MSSLCVVDVPAQAGKTTAAARLDLDALAAQKGRGLGLAAQQVNEGDFADAVVQHSILGAMRAAAVDLAPMGIRVNAICALRPRAESEEPWLKKRTPFGRASLADEIAEAALYLSLAKSAIITGETLVMDGGRGRLSGIIDDFDD